jgi:hydroxypyruvate isomerase
MLVVLIRETINTGDMPSYYFNTQARSHSVLEEENAPNLKMQIDCYHLQIMEGDIATKLRKA